MKNYKAQPTPHTEVPLTSNHNHLVHHASSSPYVYFFMAFRIADYRSRGWTKRPFSRFSVR